MLGDHGLGIVDLALIHFQTGLVGMLDLGALLDQPLKHLPGQFFLRGQAGTRWVFDAGESGTHFTVGDGLGIDQRDDVIC